MRGCSFFLISLYQSPSLPADRNNLALVLHDMGRLDEAEREFRAAFAGGYFFRHDGASFNCERNWSKVGDSETLSAALRPSSSFH